MARRDLPLMAKGDYRTHWVERMADYGGHLGTRKENVVGHLVVDRMARMLHFGHCRANFDTKDFHPSLLMANDDDFLLESKSDCAHHCTATNFLDDLPTTPGH